MRICQKSRRNELWNKISLNKKLKKTNQCNIQFNWIAVIGDKKRLEIYVVKQIFFIIFTVNYDDWKIWFQKFEKYEKISKRSFSNK